MKEPFDVELNGVVYAVFPEEDDTYTLFKNGLEYAKIQKDGEGTNWLKLDPETETPLFEPDAEVNALGSLIENYSGEEDEDEEDEE